MHDIKFIRENPALFDKALEKRGLTPQSQSILALDEQHRSTIHEVQKLQEQRNQVAKEMGTLKQKGLDAGMLIEKGAHLKDQMAALEVQEKDLEAQVRHLLTTLPNIIGNEVPFGQDEKDNQVLRTWGTPRTFAFKPKEHYELGEALELMDFETASHVSGSRFVFLKGAIARLERALAQFMLDLHTTKFGYQEVWTPLLVKDQTMFGTGQLPKFAEDSFKTENHWLIPTAEVPVTSMVAGKIVEEDALPLRMVAYTPCFRSEAGSAGKDTRGMLRQHQFSKVELVSITTPETSALEHERMTGAAEEVLKRLELPYRVMQLCSGDTGFNSQKTYDLEVWLPGQNAYREISSCSNCGAFQARRMNARYRVEKDGKSKLHFVHTLNGSGLAVGRTLIAVLENYQQEDGSIRIPSVLQSYMGGMEILKR